MTRTVKAQAFVLPQASSAVMTTVLAPSGNIESDLGTLTTVGVASQISVATGVEKVTAAPPESCGFSAAIKFVGQTIVGGIVSTTVIVWLQKFVLPQASVAI